MTTSELETISKITNPSERENERVIDGLFYSVWSDEVAQFTGLFHYSKGKGRDSIEGILQDPYGNSRIEGLLSENEALNFNKTYHGRPPISYKFSFDKERGLYLGAWKGRDAFNGYSVCKLDQRLAQPDVDVILDYFRSFDPMTDEQKAQAIIDYMLGNGDLNASPDPNTGELMLSLTPKGEELARKATERLTHKEKGMIDETLKNIKEEDGLPF
ncbi:hypothetical protein J4408_02385 [Candidatus Pacearchaeota archaeon]|nr:hypothetical protein [Candidatus Pacearchaeota archaeon]